MRFTFHNMIDLHTTIHALIRMVAKRIVKAYNELGSYPSARTGRIICEEKL